MSAPTLPTTPTPAPAQTPPKRTWRFPGIFGIVRFVLTGRWPAPRDDDDSDHSRFADRLGRFLALPMFVVFSIGALLSVVQEPIQRNWNAFVAGHTVNTVEVTAVFITLCLFGYGDITMVSAAGSLRDKIANSRPSRERIFPSFLVGAIGLLESVAFGGLIYLLEHPTTSAGWVSLIGRSTMGPLCVIWFAVTPKRVPTQDEMDQRFIYRLAMAREEILKTINFKSVNNLLFLPVIEQLRLWLNKDWNDASEKRLNEFMEMLRRLAPSEGGPSVQELQAVMALLDAQQHLTAATKNQMDELATATEERFSKTHSQFLEWLQKLKDDVLGEVQAMIASLQQPEEQKAATQTTSRASGQSDPPRALPRPTTKAYRDLVRQTIGRIRSREMRDPTVEEVAEAIGDTVANVRPAFEAIIPPVMVET
jgi:hypothetical protein